MEKTGKDLRSNLSKARGLGSAHSGSQHWLMQRITAIALVFLVIWFVVSVKDAVQIHGLQGVLYLTASPLNAIALLLLLVTAVYHGSLGVKVIIEDYVHCQVFSRVLDILIRFVAVVTIISAGFAIITSHIRSYNNPERYYEKFWRGIGSHGDKNCNKSALNGAPGEQQDAVISNGSEQNSGNEKLPKTLENGGVE